MCCVKRLVALGVIFSLNSGMVVANDQQFADYQINTHLNASDKGESRTFRLPVKETEKFLNLYAEAAQNLADCRSYEGNAVNPLIRRTLAFRISPVADGCAVVIEEYGNHSYSCFLSKQQSEQFSVFWVALSKGQGIGPRSQVEQSLLEEVCDRS